MNFALVMLFVLFGALFGAGATWVVSKLELGWNARQRVFNSAAIIPTIIALGSAGFALVILGLGGTSRFAGSNLFLLQALAMVLATFNGGLIAAYFVERSQRR